jgi:uncharacterized protein YjdB
MRKLLLVIFSIAFLLNPTLSNAQCSGTPTAGSILALPSSGCITVTSAMTLTGASSGFGIVYQWQASPNGISYTPIIGATNNTYSAIVPVSAYYNVVVTCLSSGISSITPAVFIQVDTLPVISGPSTVCAGTSINLSTGTPGGVWSSSNPSVATINNPTGVVTGITTGTTTISYASPGGCIASRVITVNPLPAVISGTPQVCETFTTSLSNTTPGGTWSSSNPFIATVGAGTGVVTGVFAGTSTISYTASTGCFNILTVTVNALPAPIAGTPLVCENYTTTLTDATPGGAWSSFNAAIASVGVSSGVVTGVTSGITTISYTLVTSGCFVTQLVTVNPSPTPISGFANVCIGSTVSLGNSISGGTWSSSNPSIAPIGLTSGVVTGLTLGTSVIAYTHPISGCAAMLTVTVQPLPNVYPVSGGGSYCAGGTGVHIGMANSDLGVSYTLYRGTSVTGFFAGIGSSLDFGLHTVAGVYTAVATNATTGCKKNMSGSATVVITPLSAPTVSVTTGTGSDSTCPGTLVTFLPDTLLAGTAPSYIWSVNGTIVSAANSYSYIPANGDVVAVRMLSNASCLSPDTATGSMTVTVLPFQTPLLSISANPGDTVCATYPVAYTASPVFGGAAPVYQWRVNGIISGSGPVFSYIPNNGDVVYARMASDYLCRLADTVASGNITMHVVPLVLPFVHITAMPGLTVAAGAPDTLIANVVNAGPNPLYQWQVNGTAITGATNSVYISIFSNNDSVTCMVTSSGFCHSLTTFDWVFIKTSTAGVQQFAIGESDIRIVPNPSRGAFAIKGLLSTTTDENLTIELADMLGQIVYRNQMTAVKGVVNVEVDAGKALANGMYILNIRSAGDQKAFHVMIEQ